MFEIGFQEIVLIMALALLVLGPDKLPGLAAKVGRWTGRARSMARQLRAQLEHEVTLEEIAKTRKATPPPAEPAASAASPEPATAPQSPADFAASPTAPAAADIDPAPTSSEAAPGDADSTQTPKSTP